jgi:HK97 family phage major capsid protein
MPTSLQLREQRANVWSQMTEVMDRSDGGQLSVDDAQTYDRLEAEYDKLDADIERAERHEARAHVDRSGVVASPGDTPDEDPDARYTQAFGNFLRRGITDLADDDRILMRKRYSEFQNAAGVGTGAAGGYLVPPEFRDKIIEAAKQFGPMLQVAEVVTTGSGANLPWPTNDDTGNVGAILGENTQITEQDVVLGTASLDAYMYTSKLVRVSYQLLQDRPDFDTWLARKLGERIGRIWNQHFTTGTGTSQPDGIVTSASVGVTGTGSFATTGGVSYDNLIDLEESLDPAYGSGEGLAFMMHQTARKAVRKLKDTTGRYLWEPSLQVGRPASLDGYDVLINNDMPTLAASSKSILFGNFREAYVIRKVQDVQTARLSERYADYLQVGFFAFARADGTLQNSAAVRVLQTTATA